MEDKLKYKKFSKSNGFGEFKDIAIELLRVLTKILDSHNIDYFFISGTLLGYVRHNDFIPWDDDIDIIVSDDFVKKYNDIVSSTITIHPDKEKLSNVKFSTITQEHFYKFSFADKQIPLEGKNYFWPFVDLFVYRITDDNINFFNKNWDKAQFYPKKKTLFNGMVVSVPSNPDYFLKLNYGKNYMDMCVSPFWNHQMEKSHGKNREYISFQTYKKVFDDEQD
jgi:phosphorylcholine metabolism protein LicD